MINFHYQNKYSDVITSPPLGPGYVLQALENAGITTKYWEYSLYPDINLLIDDIKRFSPPLIGCSFYSHHYTKTYDIIDQLSALDIPIVCGGVHVNSNGAKTLKETKADFLILGEGEESLLLLLNNLGNRNAYKKIPGLVFKQHKKIIEVPRHPLVLSNIKYPKYDKFNLKKYSSDTRLILSSRGCPNLCTFCSQSALLSKKWRKQAPENIINELEYWAQKGIINFNFADDNLTLDRNRIISLCKLIQKSRYKFKLMTSGVCINNVDQELLTIMKNSGFYYLSFGIESGNDRVLKEIKKNITVDKIHKTLEMACSMQFIIKLYFIINNRTETYEEAQDSFRLARQYPIKLARFTNLVPYPGTFDYEWIQKHGKLLFQPEKYLNNLDKYITKPLYDGPGMDLEERKQLIKDSMEELKRYSTSSISLKEKIIKALKMITKGQFRLLANALKQ